MVRFKVKYDDRNELMGLTIYIPVWFDLKNVLGVIIVTVRTIYIPVWFDLKATCDLLFSKSPLFTFQYGSI